MSASSRRRRVLIWVGVLLLAAPVAAFSQAVVLVLAVGNPSDPALSQVVARAATVELGTLSDVAAREASNEAATTPTGIPSAGEDSADFLLVVNYSRQSDSVRLDASLRTAADAAAIATESATYPFDLNLDTNVSALIGTLFSDAKVAAAIRAAALARKSAPRPDTGSASAASTSQPPTTPDTSATSTSELEKPKKTPPHRWGFASDLSGSPLLFVGTASNYFRYGGGGALFFGARLPFARTNVEAGVTAGGAALFPAVGLSAGMVYSVLGGPQIRVGTPQSLPVGIGIQVKGGAAIILAKPAGQALAAKTDLFAGGGLTAHLRLMRSLTIGMEVGVLTIFEERYPLIAIEPVLKVGFSPKK